jgi:hypothetical protein
MNYKEVVNGVKKQTSIVTTTTLYLCFQTQMQHLKLNNNTFYLKVINV